jgi:hypothetical protein
MWRGFSYSEEASHHCTRIGLAWHREAFWCVLWCFMYGYWRHTDARWLCDCLCFTIAQTSWRALSNPWSRTLGCCPHIESLEALSFGKSSAHLHESQEFEILVTQADLNMRKWWWLELIKDFELEIHYHPRKANVVAVALRRKHHCNNVMVQPLTSCHHPEEPSPRDVPHGALNNITLIPTIKADVLWMLKWVTSKEDWC